MPIIQRYVKHPSEIRAFNIDVNNLSPNTIGVVSTAIVVGAGMNVVSTTASGNRVTALLGAGNAGVEYQAETTINLSNGEVLVAQYLISVENP